MDSRLDDRLDGLDDSSIGRNVRCTSGDSGVLDSLEVGRTTVAALCEWALSSLCSPSDRSQVSERSRVGTVPAVMPRLAA